MLKTSFFKSQKPIGPLFLAVFFLPFFVGCSSEKAEPPQASFFYWKTEFELSEKEKTALNSLKINELWVRFFDVGLDEKSGKAVPLSVADLSKFPFPDFKITACAFIENRIFKQISEAENERLAERTAALFLKILDQKKGRAERFLIDCDWTASDRDAFFPFLKKLKKHLPKGSELALTVRLHQFKNYEKTGCPPADRAVLMAYNTGDVADFEAENSILDSTDASKFLDRRLDYPLPFDVALPIFRWGVVFRDEAFFRLINNLDSSQLIENERFTSISKKRFEVKKATILAGHYLHPHDQIRLEAAEKNQILWAARQLKKLGVRPERVLFYHLDSSNIETYEPAFLEKVVRIFE